MNLAHISQSLGEHFARAVDMLKLADVVPDIMVKFRLRMACVYFAQAMADQIISAAADDAPPNDDKAKKALRADATERVRREIKYSDLVSRLRLQDFHRCALQPPSPGRISMSLRGPVRLTSRQGGLAAVQGLGADMVVVEERNSTVVSDRPVQQQDGSFFDDDSAAFVPLDTILKSFLADVQKFLQSNLPPPTCGGSDGQNA